jgi:hypothetical protein
MNMGKARGHRGREYVLFTVDDDEGHRFWGLSADEAFRAIMENIDYVPVWTQEGDKLVLTFTYATELFKFRRGYLVPRLSGRVMPISAIVAPYCER